MAVSWSQTYLFGYKMAGKDFSKNTIWLKRFLQKKGLMDYLLTGKVRVKA